MKRYGTLETLFGKVDLSFAETVLNESYHVNGSVGRPAPEKRGTAFNKPVEMTDATFKEMIQNHPLVVVDCWAPWCGPCRMVAPIIEELSRDYVGRILFGKLDVDENREVSIQYDIMSIPTLLLFKNG